MYLSDMRREVVVTLLVIFAVVLALLFAVDHVGDRRQRSDYPMRR